MISTTILQDNMERKEELAKLRARAAEVRARLIAKGKPLPAEDESRKRLIVKLEDMSAALKGSNAEAAERMAAAAARLKDKMGE